MLGNPKTKSSSAKTRSTPPNLQLKFENFTLRDGSGQGERLGPDGTGEDLADCHLVCINCGLYENITHAIQNEASFRWLAEPTF